MPNRYNRFFFIADLIACSTCFGHHYAHHQELESIIQLVAACGLYSAARKPDTQPLTPHHTDNLKTKHQKPQAATKYLYLYFIAPDDGHNGARNMLSK
jgi:hypothetical protein